MFRFCWHKWGRWSHAIKEYDGSLHQVCECEKCGAIKRRKAISMMFGGMFGAEQVNKAIEETHGIKE